MKIINYKTQNELEDAFYDYYAVIVKGKISGFKNTVYSISFRIFNSLGNTISFHEYKKPK